MLARWATSVSTPKASGAPGRAQRRDGAIQSFGASSRDDHPCTLTSEGKRRLAAQAFRSAADADGGACQSQVHKFPILSAFDRPSSRLAYLNTEAPARAPRAGSKTIGRVRIPQTPGNGRQSPRPPGEDCSSAAQSDARPPGSVHAQGAVQDTCGCLVRRRCADSHQYDPGGSYRIRKSCGSRPAKVSGIKKSVFAGNITSRYNDGFFDIR